MQPVTTTPTTNGANGDHSVAEPDFLQATPLNGANGHANGAVPPEIEAAAQTVRKVMNPTAPDPSASVPNVADVLRERPASFRMWLRYIRVLTFFAWLFVRLLYWHKFVARFAPQTVEKGNLKRWAGYAREFRGFAIRGGGVMIKAGQFVSTRSDVLPEEIIRELAGLRDEIPGIPMSAIRRVIEEDLGPIPGRYAAFDEVAIAAASLGQVHRAKLHNGDKVVVKVLRPGIVDICHTDLAAFNVVAHVAMRFKFISRRADMVALTHEFGQVLLEELSYRHEAYNAERFAQMFRNDMGVYVPKIYTEHSSDRVLTMEDVTTIKLDDYAALEAAGISRRAVAKRLMDTYLKQIFEERLFHADPHPGNLFVYPIPQEQAKDPAYARLDNDGGHPFYLIFIDFGMVGNLSPQIVNGLIGTLTSVITRDSKGLIDSYGKLGFLLPGADTDRLEEATKAVFDQVWGLSMEQLKDVNFDNMATIGVQFQDLLYNMPFQVPQDFIYLGRTVSILSGMTTGLDPSFNPWSDIQPYVQRLAFSGNGVKPPAIPAGLLNTLMNVPLLQNVFSGNGGQALLGIGQTLFGGGKGSSSEQVLQRIESGEVKIKVDSAGTLKTQLFRLEMQQRKTTRAVLVGGMLVTSTLFYVNGDGLLALLGYGATGLVYLFGILWADP